MYVVHTHTYIRMCTYIHTYTHSTHHLPHPHGTHTHTYTHTHTHSHHTCLRRKNKKSGYRRESRGRARRSVGGPIPLVNLGFTVTSRPLPQALPPGTFRGRVANRGFFDFVSGAVSLTQFPAPALNPALALRMLVVGLGHDALVLVCVRVCVGKYI
jgi:hypothetical protein